MKLIKIFLFLGIVASLSSCMKNEEDEPTYFAIGDVTSIQSGNIIIEVDDSTTFIDRQNDNAKFIVGDRVMIVYSMIGEDVNAVDYNYEIDINDISKIRTKDIQVVDEISHDTLTSKPITIQGIEVQSHYINVKFIFYGNNKPHYFSMVYDTTGQVNGKYRLDFMHNEDTDAYTYAYQWIMSFDLNSFQWDGVNPIKIGVRYMTYDNVLETINLQYNKPIE